MKKRTSVFALRGASIKIAANRGEIPTNTPLRKLVIQEKRDWKQDGAPRVGWKRGEIFEVASAKTPEECTEEIGDCAYYVAQSGCWPALLLLPARILTAAARKFTKRAFR